MPRAKTRAHQIGGGGGGNPKPETGKEGEDKTNPTVVSVAFASTPSTLQTYQANEKVQVTVTFSEQVYVVTTGGTPPQIALTIGSAKQQATYETGSTTKALIFGYTVQSADADADGIEIEKDTLDANNGTIQDAAGNNAVLTHDAVPVDSTRKVDGSIVNQATAPPAPVIGNPSGKSSTGFTITWTAGGIVEGTHKKSDGEALTSAEVSYTLYYAASADASTLDTTENIKAVANQAATDSAATGGVETVAAGATAPLSKTVSSKAFIGTVYMVIEAINTTNTAKTAPSDTKDYPIIGLAAKGTTGTAPSIAATAGTTELGSISIALSDPSDWGTRNNGTPVAKKDVIFWLFYLQDAAGTKDKAAITTAVGNDPVYTRALAAPAPAQDKGVIQIAPDTVHPFVFTGLKRGTQYAFFVRIIHPDAPVGTKADERKDHERDTAVVRGTAKAPPAWHVSTLATGFNYPQGITAAPDGTVYVADTINHQIKKFTLNKDGTLKSVSIIAGDGTSRGFEETGDWKDASIGTDAQFNKPRGMAIDSTGTALYVADTDNHRIRRISLISPYKVTTIAGSTSGNADGDGTAAQFNNPKGIAIDSTGTALYVADTNNRRIRKIALTISYTVTTIAGSTNGYKDGDGTAAQFNNPKGIAIAPNGNALYVVDTGNSRIRRISLISPYKVTTIAGSTNGYKDGDGTAAQFNYPEGIAIAPNGKALYVTDTRGSRIRKIALKPPHAVTTIAGDGTEGTNNGIGTDTQFNYPRGIAAAKDKDGNTLLYVADARSNRIRKLEYK